MKKTHSFIVLILLVLAILGITDAGYLTLEHYRGGEVVCSIGEHTIGNCNTVLSSEYATVAGLPVALLGGLYYLALFILMVLYAGNMNRRYIGLAFGLSGLGFLATLWFVYLQLFVLEAICVYCMGSATITTLFFLLSGVLFLKTKERRDTP